jgi:hypothetical protein
MYKFAHGLILSHFTSFLNRPKGRGIRPQEIKIEGLKKEMALLAALLGTAREVPKPSVVSKTPKILSSNNIGFFHIFTTQPKK